MVEPVLFLVESVMETPFCRFLRLPGLVGPFTGRCVRHRQRQPGRQPITWRPLQYRPMREPAAPGAPSGTSIVDQHWRARGLTTPITSERYLVAARRFSSGECLVRSLYHGRPIVVRRPLGDAQSHRYRIEPVEFQVGHEDTNTLGSLTGLFEGGVAYHDQNLFTPPSAEVIRIPYGFVHRCSQSFQNFVTRGVAVGIIEGLEMIDIEQNDAERSRVTFRRSLFLS